MSFLGIIWQYWSMKILGAARLPLGPAGSGTTAEAVRSHFAAVSRLRDVLTERQYAKRAATGDVWVFDNRRVLHGRTAVSAASDREVEGAYFEWDDLDSLGRLVARRGQVPPA